MLATENSIVEGSLPYTKLWKTERQELFYILLRFGVTVRALTTSSLTTRHSNGTCPALRPFSSESST